MRSGAEFSEPISAAHAARGRGDRLIQHNRPLIKDGDAGLDAADGLRSVLRPRRDFWVGPRPPGEASGPSAAPPGRKKRCFPPFFRQNRSSSEENRQSSDNHLPLLRKSCKNETGSECSWLSDASCLARRKRRPD